MIRILLPLALLVVIAILARRYLNNSPPHMKKARQLNLVIAGITVILVVLTLLHRMHWIGPVLGGMTLAIRLVMQAKAALSTPDTPASDIAKSSPPISEEESLKILGLAKPYSEQDVIDSHRKLIQKFHPDRGGNDYLASQINHAKDKLLDLLKKGA